MEEGGGEYQLKTADETENNQIRLNNNNNNKKEATAGGGSAVLNIQCDINNGKFTVGCKKDKSEVYIPFSFIHKYFEVSTLTRNSYEKCIARETVVVSEAVLIAMKFKSMFGFRCMEKLATKGTSSSGCIATRKFTSLQRSMIRGGCLRTLKIIMWSLVNGSNVSALPMASPCTNFHVIFPLKRKMLNPVLFEYRGSNFNPMGPEWIFLPNSNRSVWSESL